MIARGLRARWGVALAAWAMSSLAGCGDETTAPTNVTPPSNQQDVLNGVDGLTTFGQQVLNGPGGQIVQNTPILDLVGSILLPGAMIHLAAKEPASWTEVAWWTRLVRDLPGARLAQVGVFGTWERDVTDLTQPFPGWVLVDPGNPADGLVFQFGFDDDIIGFDAGGNPVPLQGAVRFLEILIDPGAPETAEDDILTHVILEIAASPLPGIPAVVVRAPFEIVLDDNREPQSITVGSETAQSTMDPDAAFLGNLLLALQIDVTPGTTPGTFDLDAFAQVYDSTERYALRLGARLLGVDLAGTLPPTSIGLALAFGQTTMPQNPPWLIEVLFDEFVEDTTSPGTWMATVSGGIAHNAVPRASFSGSTQSVPVDVDGDMIPDTICPDILVTFLDNPANPLNLCAALPLLSDLFGPV